MAGGLPLFLHPKGNTMSDVKIDLDAVNPLVDTEPQQVSDVKVVFVPFVDCELRINQTTTKFAKQRPVKVTRDEARILLEANKGYVKD
jgi:hypothetical protein